jgi:hypothetical protein
MVTTTTVAQRGHGGCVTQCLVHQAFATSRRPPWPARPSESPPSVERIDNKLSMRHRRGAAALEIPLTPNLGACAQPKPHRHHRGQRGRGGCATQVYMLKELGTSLTPPWPRPHTLGHDSVLAATVSPRLTASGCTTGWSDRDKKRTKSELFAYEGTALPQCHGTGPIFLHNALPT